VGEKIAFVGVGRMGSGMVVCSDIPGEVESLETLARSTRK